MNLVLRIITVALYALVAGVLLGAVGMMCGSVIARTINPRPNPHLMEGVEYVFIGTLIGAAIGVIGAIVLVIRSRPRTANSTVEHPE